MKYQVISANEWIYPDSQVEENGNRHIHLSTARGSYVACQILFNSVSPESSISWEYTNAVSGRYGEWQPEIYQLIDVFVEENTGPVGFVVKAGESAEGYTSRLAPFRVYDAMKPLTENTRTRSDTEGLYICWKIETDTASGIYTGEMTITIGEEKCTVFVSIEVFSATVPEKETLSVSNWFILSHMADRHNLERWSEEHWAMIRRYGELMRRARQTHFWVTMETIDVEQKDDGTYHFCFDKTERLIRLFLELGFTHIEGGMVAVRRQFTDSEFVVRIHDQTLRAISSEGYSYISQYLTAWRKFLDKHGWLNIIVQHVADEPTENCAEEYRILSGIVRKFMPGVPLIEAVEIFDLEGAVDIWIPKNYYYETHRHQFEKVRALGDKLWFYTCCLPGGYYMNRLLDMPLLRTRYLHWGNYIYNLEGFLHWGFNYYLGDQDPFDHASPVLADLSDSRLPPGDTHIAYPGTEGPWGSVRLEAMRAGIEDYELLTLLAHKDKALADEIAASCMTSFKECNEDSAHFERAHSRLLQSVSDYVRGGNFNEMQE
ncbi:DUF4091 domain-containing protein [Dictyobacter formicarum]|uniref:Glycoside hydrolase 123 catalytic domain-containing protein n=1 Tax=Dictyobacter formicarum TaxID=2778368 RepID=A0ABQ3VGJ7_9CHLR|nr:DUF4091 domain-containing protein [Dictyobacter formicarum]GHO84241.1 hypothetical protein KSZ_22470 [Dictyobacter formicarum]